MAVPFVGGGSGTHYYDTSVITDVTQFLYQISPEDTPFFHLCGDAAAAGAPAHSWQYRDLAARADNAQAEGGTYLYTAAMRLPTRQTNLTQILSKEGQVSNSEQASKHYAIEDSTADQVDVKVTELKNDMELTLLRGTAASGNATNAARRMAGIIPMIVTSVSNYTSFAGTVTISEAIFNSEMEHCYNLGAVCKDVFVDGKMKRCISSFSAGGSAIHNPETRRKTLSIDFYQSDFFPVSIHLCRDMGTASIGNSTAARRILFIDSTQVKKAWLRAPAVKRTPEIGDAQYFVAISELTLEWGHPLAHGLLADLLPNVA